MRSPLLGVAWLAAAAASAEVAVRSAFEAPHVRPESFVAFHVTILQDVDPGLVGREEVADILTRDVLFGEVRATVPRFENAAWIAGPHVDVTSDLTSELGSYRQRSVLTWRVMPRRAGTLYASGVRVWVGPDVHELEPASTEVSDGAPAERSRAGYRIQVLDVVDRTHPCVGEGVTLATWVLANGRVRDLAAATVPEMPGFRVDEAELPAERPEMEVILEGQRFLARLHSVRVLYPVRSGPAVVPGCEYLLSIDDGSRWATPVGASATTAATQIEVRELPADVPPPAGYAGAVGRFRLEASVGGEPDAASLVVTVTGRGDLRSVPAPSLPEIPGVRVRGPRAEERLAFDGREAISTKRFTWELEAARARSVGIRGIRLVAFDPELGRYRTSEAPEIHAVIAAREGSPAATAGPGVELRPLKLLPAGTPGTGRRLAATLLCVNLLLLGRRLARRSRGGASPRRARARATATLEAARRAASPRDRDDLVVRAISGLVADLAGGGGKLAGGEVGRALEQAGVATDLRAEVASFLAACDDARFGAASTRGERGDPVGQAALLVDRLARALAAARPSTWR